MRKFIVAILLTLMLVSFSKPVFALTDEEIQAQLDQINATEESGNSMVSPSVLSENAKTLIYPTSLLPEISDDEIYQGISDPSDYIDYIQNSNNNINMNKLHNAYIINGTNRRCLWGYWSHTGMYDKLHNSSSEDARVFISAWPSRGVCYQTKRHFHLYNKAVGMRVIGATDDQRSACVYFGRSIIGRPYSLFASKGDDRYFYCSKVPWRAYSLKARRDLDYNGGYWVTPDNLYKHWRTIPVSYGS